VNNVYAQLAAQRHDALKTDGFEPERRTFLPTAEMRYRGQEHTVNVPMPGLSLTPEQIPGIIDSFNKVHQQQYGHSMMQDPIEIVTLRLRAVGLLPRPDLPKLDRSAGQVDAARKGAREVFVRENRAHVTYTVYDRMKLGAGDRIEGPAIIEEPSSTTMVHASDVLTVGDYGELVIQVG
ncbi:MAG: hydantoinase/oxoprolinase family protein, partial [Anaerolineae bacterium]|nr:hydantoinase/oxoprolinase family protein [Anaerolineae bacterium]